MKTYKLLRDDGCFFAFEIENAYIRPKKVARILERIDGVTDVQVSKFMASPDVRVEFKYSGYDFIVWEPFGDNSRYWIGPKEEGESIDIASIERVFKDYRPPLVAKIFGDLITLNFKSLFRG